MRLENDRDKYDNSGLDIAQQVRRDIPKIINTNHDSAEAVLVALKMDYADLPPAVNFVFKRDGAEALRLAIREAFLGLTQAVGTRVCP